MSAAARPAGGVFGHLAPKGPLGVRAVEVPAVTMTWDKFARTVLPGAERMELLVPVGRGPFMALTSAVHADAPPILRWDRGDRRNPVALYTHHHGSPPQQWALIPGSWHKMSAVVPYPMLWGDKPLPYLGEGLVLVLDGALDSHNAGAVLFPEALRDELRAAWATIEAFSRRASMGPPNGVPACGYGVSKSAGPIGCTLRVHAGGRHTD